MKKIVCIFCICILALSVIQTAYAGANKNPDKGIKEEIVVLNDQIRQNKDEIIQLKQQVASVTASIQAKVSQLASNKTAITQSKAADLKTVLSIIKNSKKSLKGIKGDGLKQYIADSKADRENKSFEQALDKMNKVLELQETRKQTLNQILNDLNTANQLL